MEWLEHTNNFFIQLSFKSANYFIRIPARKALLRPPSARLRKGKEVFYEYFGAYRYGVASDRRS